MITFLSDYQIMGMNFSMLICIFMLYNFIGWFYESTIFSIGEQGRFVNKGYFIGPYCPIYGAGFFLNMYMLYEVQSPIKIFLISMATCTVIEYITSYTLEKLFDARYWDYSYYPLNINGRVSVISSVFFGLTITFMMKIITPLVIKMFARIPIPVLNVVAIVLTIIFISDCVITYICMQNLNRKCRALYDAWDEYVDGKLDILNEKKDSLEKFAIVRQGQKLLVKAKNVNQLFLNLETRYIKNNGFKSVKYAELVDKMKGFFSREKAE